MHILNLIITRKPSEKWWKRSLKQEKIYSRDFSQTRESFSHILIIPLLIVIRPIIGRVFTVADLKRDSPLQYRRHVVAASWRHLLLLLLRLLNLLQVESSSNSAQ